MKPTKMTILPTYGCTAACANCCFGSHPGITARISLDEILDAIDQAASLGTIKLIVFSGGECFTLGDELVIAVAQATQHHIATRCVSNGYWADSFDNAVERLLPLRRAGLSELNLSTGDYHQRYVPPARIINGARAALHIGLPVVIMVESREGREFTARTLLRDEQLASILQHPDLTILESPWMPMEEESSVQQPQRNLVNRHNLHRRGGCDSVLDTVVVTPRRQLGACCGLTREQIPELHVGSLAEEPLETLVERASRDFMKIWLSVEGPEHILAWAASKNPSIEWEDRYSHHCHACRALYHDPRVREVIANYYMEKKQEILFRYFVSQAATPVSEQL